VFHPCFIRVSSVFHPCFIRVSSVANYIPATTRGANLPPLFLVKY
jgi:hypothetical protein